MTAEATITQRHTSFHLRRYPQIHASFPSIERVIYQNNTLGEVVCQLRFPTILRIEASSPADFQDAIREAYPLFITKKSPELPPGMQSRLLEW